MKTRYGQINNDILLKLVLLLVFNFNHNSVIYMPQSLTQASTPSSMPDETPYIALNETLNHRDHIFLTKAQFQIYNATQQLPVPKIPPEALWNIAKQFKAQSRGIIIPMYDKIAVLGLSMILQLQSEFRITLPIEIPHCTKFNEKYIKQFQSRLLYVRIVFEIAS